ncbi:CC chemokine 1 [Solea senegalensis]|uniref:CC chemokine 1 n=2 Tax=Solea senegalensis TaxID=28829 RepID=A0AAV6TAH9_SOLSE|nr:CC chemokine 1 [Solea senegalensis]
MLSCGNVFRSALVAIVLFALLDCGAQSIPQKITPCCKKVSTQPVTEPITGFTVQKTAPPCVTAVIFFTNSGFYCSLLRAPWVRKKISEFM